MIEIRIYYECLEQANDYIKPMIEKEFGTIDVNINLVKRPKKANQFEFKSSLYAILSLTTPDILITGIINDTEYPLIMIEFTEAVQTEDHELQRSYGAVASYFSNMFYVKVSGFKKSEKEFGGAKYNPYNTPKILIEKLGYEGFIIADWETDVNNENELIRSELLPGCPPPITILNDTVKVVIKSFISDFNNWYTNSIDSLKRLSSYDIFIKKVVSANSSFDLLIEWKCREKRNKNINRLRYFVTEKSLAAKINRFSHTMDPDRGILTFISFVYSETHKIYGIYALVRPRSTEILKRPMNNINDLREKLGDALKKDYGGIPDWFANGLIDIISNASSMSDELNIQDFWLKNIDNIKNNKVVLTIALFLDGLFLNHNGIKLYWDRKKLLNDKDEKFLNSFSSYFGFSNYSIPSRIGRVENEVDEDEVTYAITHRVLIPNGFKIVSISYPGSQGGGAVLPEPQKGKAQPRKYPDIISIPPKKAKNIDVVINESKGMFNKSSVESDLRKILLFKTEKSYKKALKETLINAHVYDKYDKLVNILIGVSFGVSSNNTTWNPAKVDFIFIIINRNKWKISISNDHLNKLIKTLNGNTNFPMVYKLSHEENLMNLNLFE